MKRKPKYIKPVYTKGMRAISDSTYIRERDNIRTIYEDAQMHTNGGIPLEVNEEKIHRIMVNEIRHRHSNYNSNLKHVHRMDRKNDAQYYLYKNIVLEKIATAYPFLAEECRDQKYRINMVRIRK